MCPIPLTKHFQESQPLFIHKCATQNLGRGVTGLALRRSLYGSFTISLYNEAIDKCRGKKKDNMVVTVETHGNIHESKKAICISDIKLKCMVS